MNYRNCLFLLLLVSVCASLAQRNKPSPWKEYAYPKDGFAITAPTSPGIHADPQSSDVQIYRWELAPNVVFVIHSGIRPNCTQVLLKLKDSAQKNQSQAFIAGSLKDISLSGYSGLEYESIAGATRRAFERLYCTKEGKSYALTVAYPRDQPKPDTANRMFSSFRLLETSSR
jgi:hypothetical protein